MKTSLLFQPQLTRGDAISACPACGSPTLRRVGDVPEAFHFCSFQYRHPVNRATLMECEQCDFHFKSPCLSVETLDDLYRQQPSTVWGSSVEGREDVARLIRFVESREDTELRILDFGCFTGSVLLALGEALRGKKTLHPFGIEPSKEAAARAAAAGIQILGASIDDLGETALRFDLIVLTDVFEHILSIKVFLERLRRYLAPGGMLVLVTGAFDSPPFARHRHAFHYCAMPEHLGFISRRHSEWLASTLRMDLVRYELISHTSPAPFRARLKKLIKTAIFRATRWIPTPVASLNHGSVNRLARLRGMGVQNSRNELDHAFVVLAVASSG